ncbi:MAG: CocE/NonD family hydrolase [Myxococcales bacterium]|nr:CocE/NonD family hydrolase [Myxococcales bacterium]
MRSAVPLALALGLVTAGCRDKLGPPQAAAPAPTLAAPAAAPPPTPPAPPSTADVDERAAFLRAHYRKFEYRVPMRDGVHLFTAVYVPADASPGKRYPFLLHRTPYTVAPYGSDRYPKGLGPVAAVERAGYIFVEQDVRGKGMSEGAFVDMRPHLASKRGAEVDESSDAYDTIAWLLAHVPDHNGRAGIWGISYPGFYAAAAAIDAHPALVAVSPEAPCLDWWQGDDMHRHGAFALQEAFTFFSRFGRPHPAPSAAEGEALWPSYPWGTPDAYAYFLKLGPLAGLDAATFGGDVAIWRDFVAHPDYDEFWRARNHAQYLTGVRPAVLTVGGFYDAENAYGAINTFRAIEAGRPRGATHVLMGPWRHHGWDRGPSATLGDAEFGFDTSTIYPDTFLGFFEHHLKGAAAPGLAKATVFESGANRWRRFAAWPPPGAVARTLYLQPAGGLAWAAPTAPGTFDEFVSDPARPVPYTRDLGTAWMPPGFMAEDQRPFARRPDVLVYQTEPLAADVTLAGPLTAQLQVATTGTDADWIVKLIDVAPDVLPGHSPEDPGARGGQQTLVRAEPMRGRYRDDPAAPTAFVPDQVTPVAIPITDVCHTFGRGHRVMIQIQSTWFPFIDRNPQTFVPNVFAATAADYVKATHRVYTGSDHPTALTVTVLPAADE